MTDHLQNSPRKPRKGLRIFLILLAIVVAGGIGFGLFMKNRMDAMADMSFAEALDVLTADNPGIVLTVGILRDGNASFTVYGSDNEVLPHTEHVYEIGSISKTFTGALLCREIVAGRMSLSDPLVKYLPDVTVEEALTLEKLVTHTSGLKSEYDLSIPALIGTFRGKNALTGITVPDLVRQLNAQTTDFSKAAPFSYSNFGIALVGAALENELGVPFTTAMNDFIRNDLQLKNTVISTGDPNEGDLGNLWQWRADDGYLPAGALLSTIGDMLQYAAMNLAGEPGYLKECQRELTPATVNNPMYDSFGIRIDGVGTTWIHDHSAEIIWHNGGTGNYNSYLALDPARDLAVVLLVNRSSNDRVPVTVLGIKLMNELQHETEHLSE